MCIECAEMVIEFKKQGAFVFHKKKEGVRLSSYQPKGKDSASISMRMKQF